MREIIYIQAGQLANYTGTHFWNQQSSYFTYGNDEEESEEPLTLHDISFREGFTEKGDATYCPRLLVFDRKSNFGTLAQHNALGGAPDDYEEDPSLWMGETIEIKQDPISKSDYQMKMDEEGENDDEGDVDSSKEGVDAVDNGKMRYWSDFNRVYYVPRTIQKVPEPAEWEHVDGDWEAGRASFRRFDEDMDLMEGPVRAFMEECDSLQGIQILNDTSSFGSFTVSFLTSVMDDYMKIPSLVFPFLSGASPHRGITPLDDVLVVKNVLNDALYLRTMNELASLVIPIQSPFNWGASVPWNDTLDIEAENIYATSALLSTHVESCTLPLRLKKSPETFAAFTDQLNWRGSTRFGQMSGSLPAPTKFSEQTVVLFDFSVMLDNTLTKPKPTVFARRDVSRGLSTAQLAGYDTWSEELGLPRSYVVSTHAATYTLPTSFPVFHRRTDKPLYRPRDTTLLSSLSTSTLMARTFSGYAKFVEECVRKGVTGDGGTDKDELKELANDLWSICDNYGSGNGDGTVEWEEGKDGEAGMDLDEE